MTGLGAQLGKFKHGIGTPFPFRFLTFEGKKPEELKLALEDLNIPGLSYSLKTLTLGNGKKVSGVYLVINDWNAWRPTDLPFYMMKLTALWQSPNPFTEASDSEATLFNKHVGSQDWWDALCREGGEIDPNKFFKIWDAETRLFKSNVEPYLLY